MAYSPIRLRQDRDTTHHQSIDLYGLLQRVAPRIVRSGVSTSFRYTSADLHLRLAEVRLGGPRRMGQRHEHLALRGPLQPHVVFDDGVAAREVVLVSESFEDPLGGVPLLLRQR